MTDNKNITTDKTHDNDNNRNELFELIYENANRKFQSGRFEDPGEAFDFEAGSIVYW